MVPLPQALGLNLCDYVLIEERTRKISLIGILTRLRADAFPFVPPRFFAYAALIDGMGDATITLSAVSLDADEEVFSEDRQVHFSDRLRELHVVWRVVGCSFPAAGWYRFELAVDREVIAHRRLRITSAEDVP